MNKFSTWMVAASVCFLAACADDAWDNHYNSSETPIANEQLERVDETSYDYLQSQSNLGSMFNFLKQHGVFTTLEEKGQLHTLLVVENENFENPVENDTLVALSHVTDIAISPSNLYDGERLLMWHKKFVTISMDSIALMGDSISHILFNSSPVKQVIKTTDGYIYVLSSMIYTPKSLYDFIQQLPEEYSTFQNMILESGGKTFDRANSKPIGVDNTGNTIYDSVFIYTNDFFDEKNFGLSSESLTATMLLFSNEVIDRAMATADSTLKVWNMTRDMDILKKWILEVAFYNTRYTPIDFTTDQDLTSIYSRQWRTSKQVVDIDNPVSLSNAVVYEVKELRIPNNMLMYRLKDWFYYYEYCSEEQKSTYFVTGNLINLTCNTDVTDWTPEEGVWPSIRDRVLQAKCSEVTQGYYMNFTPIKYIPETNGVAPWTIPPGTYRLAMGFKSNLGVLDITVYAKKGTELVNLGSKTIDVNSATTFHYDRGATLSDGYPEGYTKEEITRLTGIGQTKAKNYDTDGGPVFDEIEVPDLNAGLPVELMIHLESATGGSATLTFTHWCLRPTSNNY